MDNMDQLFLENNHDSRYILLLYTQQYIDVLMFYSRCYIVRRVRGTRFFILSFLASVQNNIETVRCYLRDPTISTVETLMALSIPSFFFCTWYNTTAIQHTHKQMQISLLDGQIPRLKRRRMKAAAAAKRKSMGIRFDDRFCRDVRTSCSKEEIPLFFFPLFFCVTQSEWHLWDFGCNNNMAPESESIVSELKCVTRSASAQVKNCWRRSFPSYLTCASADNGTKEKRGDWWKSASQTLVGRCGTCFWVVAVQVECVNPLGTKIEIWTTKKWTQSNLVFFSPLPCC